MKLTAFIPTKKFSRRLHKKNYHLFFGRPINEWILEEVKKAEIFNSILVSSNENRPREFLADDVKIEKVLKYHIDNWEIPMNPLDYICVIYPCAYAVTAEHLISSLSKMLKEKKEYCYSYGVLNKGGDYQLDNGGFYWVKAEAFIRDNTFVPPLRKEETVIHTDAIRYELPQVDINVFEDFLEAKLHAMTLSCKRFKI